MVAKRLVANVFGHVLLRKEDNKQALEEDGGTLGWEEPFWVKSPYDPGL